MTETGAPTTDRPEKVQFLFETATDAVVVAEPDGTVLDANDRAVDHLGTSREDLRSTNVAAVEVGVDREDLRERWRDVDADRPVTHETEHRRVDGSTVPVERTVREVTIDGRERMILSCRDVNEKREREQALERYESIVDTIEDGVYVLDEDLRFSFVNDALCRMVDIPREELIGSLSIEYFEYEDEKEIARETRQRVVDGDTSTGTFTATYEASAGPRRIETRYRLHPEPVDEFRGSVGVIRDVTGREERERTLRRQRDELATLDRINELLLETVRELVQTSSRDAVEQRVCDRLAEASFYDVTWIGERAFSGDGIVPRVVAGDRAEYLESVTFDAGDASPAGRALVSGSVTVVHVGDPEFEPWREAARAHGLDTIAAVPLRHGEQVYGVLEVASSHDEGFSERERAGLDVLGRTVGFVVYASRSRDLLFADSVVELAFDVTAEDVPLVDRGGFSDCELELEGYVPVGDEWLCYLAAAGRPPEAVLEARLQDPTVENGRVITDGEDGGTLELRLGESTLLDAVTAVGATVGEARHGPDGARVVVYAPADRDAREVVKRVHEATPTATLTTHRERDREVTTVGRPNGVLSDLTARQQEVLRTAYRAGYFAWPRESDAAAVADALDIDRSTMHGHLRKAEERLLSALLDEG